MAHCQDLTEEVRDADDESRDVHPRLRDRLDALADAQQEDRKTLLRLDAGLLTAGPPLRMRMVAVPERAEHRQMRECAESTRGGVHRTMLLSLCLVEVALVLFGALEHLGHAARLVLRYAVRPEDVVDLALDLRVARLREAFARRRHLVLVVVYLSLRREEATDAHRDGARDELGKAGDHDETGRVGARESSGECEWDLQKTAEETIVSGVHETTASIARYSR